MIKNLIDYVDKDRAQKGGLFTKSTILPNEARKEQAPPSPQHPDLPPKKSKAPVSPVKKGVQFSVGMDVLKASRESSLSVSKLMSRVMRLNYYDDVSVFWTRYFSHC
jgi:hypothetical protein